MAYVDNQMEKLTPMRGRSAATLTLASDPHTVTATTGGFMVDSAGTYKLALAGDSAANFITIYLVPGVHYWLEVGWVWATGSPAGAKFTGFLAS